jgi:hypothetical protein
MRLPKIIKHALEWTTKTGRRAFSCVQFSRSGEFWTAVCTDGSKLIELSWRALDGESNMLATQMLLDAATGHKTQGLAIDAEMLSQSLKSIDVRVRNRRKLDGFAWRGPEYRSCPYDLNADPNSTKVSDFIDTSISHSLTREPDEFPKYEHAFDCADNTHAEIDLDARQLAFVVDAVKSLLPGQSMRHARVTIKLPIDANSIGPSGSARRALFYATSDEVSVRAAICELLK